MELISTNPLLFRGFILSIEKYVETSKVIGYLQPLRPTDYLPISDVFDQIQTKSLGNIIISCGAMGSRARRELVDQCRADRELRIYHFNSSSFFPLSSLASRPRPFAAVQFITLASFRRNRMQHLGISTDIHLEDMLATNLKEHHQDCLREDRVGLDCFRAVNLHGRSFFSVEQMVTFWTYAIEETGPQMNGRWSGVLCSDFGMPRGHTPWMTGHSGFKDADFFSIRTTNLEAGIPEISDFSRSHSTADTDKVHDRPNPFISRVQDDKAMPLSDQSLCIRDPFVFIADLFDTSALCWMQILSFLRNSFHSLPEDPKMKVRLLARDKKLLDRAIWYFSETLCFIDSRGMLEWPRYNSDHPEDPKAFARVKRIEQGLKADFAILRDNAKGLSELFKEAINIEMSNMNIESAQEALLESKRVQSVTYLAFIFGPLSLVASFFGMNVYQFSHDKNNPSIWWFVGASVIIFLVSMVVVRLMERRAVRVKQGRTQWPWLSNLHGRSQPFDVSSYFAKRS
ncbi:hypothetical protein F5X97DRAFT_261772 [Nemania serpens]|nr:hypothetical protein F5X97DRAFT_261772 [Nemania serpens]